MKPKKRMRRRMLGALLCVAMLFSLCLQTAFADTMTTTFTVGTGNTIKFTVCTGNGVPETTVTTSGEDLQATINLGQNQGDLQTALADASTTVVEDVVLEICKVSASDILTTSSTTLEKLGMSEDQVTIAYFGIDPGYMYTITDTDGNVTRSTDNNQGWTYFTETAKPLVFTIARPSELPKGNNIGYQVVYHYGDDVGNVNEYYYSNDVTYDAVADTISFSTDKFDDGGAIFSIVAHEHTWDAGTANGDVMTYTCSLCGQTITGKVSVSATSYDGAPETTIATSKDDLLASIKGRDEVEAALDDGSKSVTEEVSLDVTKKDTVDNDTAAKIFEKLGVSESQVSVVYLDLELSYFAKVINEDGLYDYSDGWIITETLKPIAITIARPADLPKGDNIGYQIVRQHENTDGTISYDLLTDVTYDSAADTISFTSDKFSTYAVAAHEHTWDAGKVTTVATTTTEGVKTYTCTICGATKTESIAKLAATSPKTGDNSMTVWYVALIGCAGAGIAFCMANRKRKVDR